VASTLVCVAVAGPVLSVAGGHGVPAVHVLITLALVAGIPLLAGMLLRRILAAGDRVADGCQVLAITAVVVLVWLVSGQVRLSAAYAALTGVLVALIAASAAIGLLLARRLECPAKTAVLLNVSMRDFAVASGIAAAAFGPAATAPLGIYGVLVIAWGTLIARVVKRRRR
jgi:BASS family bile acid:Na+ symporter